MTIQNFIDWRRILLAALVILVVPFTADAADSTDLKFEIQIIPELKRFEEFLAYPAYLALILDINGLSPSLSHRTVLTSARAVQVRNVIFRFVENSGATYRYDAILSLNLGVTETELKIPVAVDTTAIGSGVIAVKLTGLLAKAIPTEFVDRVQWKAQLLANIPAQKKVYAYLDHLSKVAKSSGTVTTLFEAILMDAYNQSASTATVATQSSGNAYKLSDQWAFTLIMVTWIVVVSFAAFVKRRRNGRTAPTI